MNHTPFNHEGFVVEHMANSDRSLAYKHLPIQIYPLRLARSFIKPPIPLFRTDYNFILLFLDGGGVQQVDNELYELNANDVLFIREGHLNSIRSIKPATEGYFIHLNSLLVYQVFDSKALLNRLTFHPKHSVSKDDMAWLHQCCKLMDHHQSEFTDPTAIGVALLRAIVLKLADTWPEDPTGSDRRSEIAMNFKEMLYENFMKIRDVEFYVHSLAVSENYLTRCVKHVTGRSPKQQISELVIHHSKVLLQDPRKTISQIAFALSFADASHFGRLFKQVTKLTPSQFRNSLSQHLSEHLPHPSEERAI